MKELIETLIEKKWINFIVLFLIGALLLIIGMEATTSRKIFVDTDGDQGEIITSGKISISQILSSIKIIAVVNGGSTNINLFDIHNLTTEAFNQTKNLIDFANLDPYGADYRNAIYTLKYFRSLRDLANVAIAGFSFMMISISGAIGLLAYNKIKALPNK